MVDQNFKVRKPAVSGSFYPSSPEELSSALEKWVHPCEDSASAPQAILVPHAGYVFSGEVAASAYSRLCPGFGYKRIFLLGPSHRVGFPGASVDLCYAAETPLGLVSIDYSIGEDLIERGGGVFTFKENAHAGEHCLEVQLPFLQAVFGDDIPPIIPIVIGTERLSILMQIAKVLGPYFNRENLFVISSDFSHYPSYEDAEESDTYLAGILEIGGLTDFLTALSEIRKKGLKGQDTAACGACAIEVLLSMMDSEGRDTFDFEPIMYRNSGDSPYGDRKRVVGYNSMALYRLQEPSVLDSAEAKDSSSAGPDSVVEEDDPDPLFIFTYEEKRQIIAAARSSIYSALGLDSPVGYVPSGVLKEKGFGVFVTLYLYGRLRGCIGRFTSDASLDSTIREMARSSALSDPRFPPLTKNEAQRIEIEVSVLSPLKKIESVDEFKLGRDGIYMIKGSHHGTFLPQVAQQTGWDTEEFLGHCARDKAGIGYYGWMDADLYTYRTEIVKESDIRSSN